jgi:electron transfer flavoprotein beta subunit
MSMNVMVLAKYVPNPQGVPDLGPDGLVIREDVEGGLDPSDEFGVEAGLQIVEAHGGEVTLVSMGPEIAIAGVRRALAMGAHGSVLITDDRLRGADVLVTARVLAAAIRRRPFDLVIAGTESTDGYTGTLPEEVAELLGLPSVTFVRRLEVADGVLRVERQTPAGYDVLECPLPALVTVTSGANEPRYPTMKGIMQAKQKPLERPALADLGLTADETTSHQAVASVADAPARTAGDVIEWDADAVGRIVELLSQAKVV